MKIALLSLLVATTGALVVLVVWAFTLYRRTGSSFGGLAAVWVIMLGSADLLRLAIELQGPSTPASVLLALSLIGFLVAQVVLIRRLFGSWIGAVLDVFLTGIAVVLTG